MILDAIIFTAKVAGALAVLAFIGALGMFAFFRITDRQQRRMERDVERRGWFEQQNREAAEDELALAGKPITDENIEAWLAENIKG